MGELGCMAASMEVRRMRGAGESPAARSRGSIVPGYTMNLSLVRASLASVS